MTLFKKESDMTLSQLSTLVKELQTKVSDLECKLGGIYCTGATNSAQSTTTTTTVNKVSQRADYEYIDFTTKQTPSGIELSWDLSKFENSLPTNSLLRDVRVVADTKDRTVINSNKKANTVLLDATATNPQIEVRLKVESKDEGLMRYDKIQILETVTDGNKVVALNPTIPTEERELTLAEVNDRLVAEIEKLKKQMV